MNNPDTPTPPIDTRTLFRRFTNAHFDTSSDEYREGASDAAVARRYEASRVAENAFLERVAEMEAKIAMLDKETARLTDCLTTANKNHEHFEREWYLSKDREEALREQVRVLSADVFSLINQGIQIKDFCEDAKSRMSCDEPNRAIVCEQFGILLRAACARYDAIDAARKAASPFA